nr:RNA polymerase II subunit 5-mediating protein homolog isoform X1 [Nicotiana tomentosiformis]XP_009606808.1 RNA polymerase II subunit 5-mediating protein homolog isoform X1 [Nicotiana tomentosiformis]XP_009606809.1 RNA polymerase II subunit 5-mediating protein homolog isoform X1 [Nicotiana tomentosiformis]XP_009606810.1 RNA polymerase II subunit 5-mediating protein homolog isoform X1 [Nicotiana tomentosiformis]XP_009606811.1 RNA polymerase II subunit 5-mediating protein homolog isoform X1 [Ni
MEARAKGTVTSLSSLFPVEEAQKASKRVQDTIADRQKQLDLLRDFAADNNNLINLVQRLPDQLHHDIMVPFGKAAFFPGSLIHTNEFLVLLGEGYYAERTSKQTTELLKRRGKDLESQVESVKAVIQDLKAEASFFDATASEAAEGLVEIREDYVEETSPEGSSTVGILKPDLPISSEGDNAELAVEDEEYARILSRIAELEKEEEAENAELEKEEEEAEIDTKFNEEGLGKSGLDVSTGQHIRDQEIKDSGVHGSGNLKERAASTRNHSTEGFPEQLHVESSKTVTKGEYLAGSLAYDKSNITESAPKQNRMKEDTNVPIIAENKAFTGSIVERVGAFDIKPSEQTVGRSSKPVSRFKMQRK